MDLLMYITEQKKRFVRDYPSEITYAEDGVVIGLEHLSAEEVDCFIDDIASLAEQAINDDMQRTTINTIPVLLKALRILKKSTRNYTGTNAKGLELVATWLEPWHIGNSKIMQNPNIESGIYGSKNGATLSWEHLFVSGEKYEVYPSQVLDNTSVLIHIGVSDSVQTPNIIGVQHKISGISMPVQVIDLFSSCIRNNKEALEKLLPFANEKNTDLFKYLAWPSFIAFSKPIIILPSRQSEVTFYANITGNSSPRLVTILISTAQNLCQFR